MKRKLISIILACTAAVSVMAIPARPGIMRTVTLADGSIVTAELRGDENYHFYLLADGTPLVLNADGKWEASSMQVVRERYSQRASARNERRIARAAKTREMFRKASRVRRRDGQSVVKKRGLVILVNFKDVAFKETSKREYFEQMCNAENNPFGENYGSVHDYFMAQSYGQFDLEFDVVGPYTLTYGMTYYGRDTDPADEGSDAHPEEMVEEACKLADDDVYFRDYDWDNDGEVDQVYVFYAGYGQSSNASSNTIWPHEWDLESAFYYNNKNYNYRLVLDGVKINTYACGSELYGTSGSVIDGVGTMCHEFSHCLGLPDFYDTTGKYLGMDSWDVMDLGCYNGDGYQPAGYTAYERWFCGWLEPTVLTEPVTVTEMPAIQDEPVAYALMRSGTSADINSTYYLMYNHQMKGWDKVSYGHGMLVQYVRYLASAWENNTVNNTTQRMTLIPADGDFTKGSEYGDAYLAGDPWPGSKRKTEFTWNDHTVSGITEQKGLISFLFDGGSARIASPVINPDGVSVTDSTFTTAWFASEGAVSYNLRYRVKPSKPSPAQAMLLNEDFSNVADVADGSKDISLSLNQYMHDRGWEGTRVYRGLFGAKLGASKFAGEMKTPLLEGTTGTVTVLFNARPWTNNSGVDDNSGMQVLLYDGNSEVTDVIQLDTIFGEDEVLTFTNVPASFRIGFATLGAGRRAYLCKVIVYDGTYTEDELQEADVKHVSASAWTMVTDITETSQTITGLSPFTTYQYQVQAVDADAGVSDWSDLQTVTLGGSDAILLPKAAWNRPDVWYDMSGRRLMYIPTSRGIYINAGRKVIVR